MVPNMRETLFSSWEEETGVIGFVGEATVVVGGVTTGVVLGETVGVVGATVVEGSDWVVAATMVVGGATTGVVFCGTVGVGGAKVSNFSPGKVVKLYPSQGAF